MKSARRQHDEKIVQEKIYVTTKSKRKEKKEQTVEHSTNESVWEREDDIRYQVFPF